MIEIHEKIFGRVFRIYIFCLAYPRKGLHTPRGTQGKQQLCADLRRTTLNAVNYKTYSDARNQFSTL